VTLSRFRGISCPEITQGSLVKFHNKSVGKYSLQDITIETFLYRSLYPGFTVKPCISTDSQIERANSRASSPVPLAADPKDAPNMRYTGLFIGTSYRKQKAKPSQQEKQKRKASLIFIRQFLSCFCRIHNISILAINERHGKTETSAHTI